MKKTDYGHGAFPGICHSVRGRPLNAADNTFLRLCGRPRLNNLSIKDDKASYQWALKNDGQAQK